MKIAMTSNVKQLWHVESNLGELKGSAQETANGYSFENGVYSLTTKIDVGLCGVTSRKDRLTNASEQPMTVCTAASRFTFDGSDYDVYTQANGWINESVGAWQQLNTGVLLRNASVRTASSFAPFVVLWNRQTNRGTAFHLLPDCAWTISVSRQIVSGGYSTIELELGIDNAGLALELAPGEALDFPEILFYDVRSRTDLDCWKLHHYINDRWPRRLQPVIFNSWLFLFSNLEPDNVMANVPAAAKLGAEYYVIDAGWFGDDPEWSRSIGDWYENTNGGFYGRMKEVADCVRANGMKFGLWFEIERALGTSKAVAAHPEHYVEYEGQWFVDFASPSACDYIFEVLSGMITRYGIEFIKFDFNADMLYDCYRSAFIRYYEGYRAFIARLRDKYPTVYLENCASGGLRMNLTNLRDFDSYWFTDNQGPVDGIHIIKNTMLRLPPQAIERWVSVRSLPDVLCYPRTLRPRTVTINGAMWDNVAGIQDTFLQAFLTGGPMGFSCDLEKISGETFELLRTQIAQFKADRAFWLKAACRILCDTENLMILQYCDEALTRSVITVISKTVIQREAVMFPAVDPDAAYELSDGSILTGREIEAGGLRVSLNQDEGHYQARTLTLQRKA